MVLKLGAFVASISSLPLVAISCGNNEKHKIEKKPEITGDNVVDELNKAVVKNNNVAFSYANKEAVEVSSVS